MASIELTFDQQQAMVGLPGVLLPWYERQARDLPWRQDREPYHVWLSEIMLQQTRVEVVKGYYRRFLASLPDIPALAQAPEEKVYKLWEGLGYYRRARHLHQAARQIMTARGGVFPQTYEEILALSGIGEYTAGALASICFGLPRPAVDGNVLRVAARILDSDIPVENPAFGRGIRQVLAGMLQGLVAPAAVAAAASSTGGSVGRGEGTQPKEQPAYLCGQFNQSLMELGALLCLPKGEPQCGRCPAASLCLGRRSGRAAGLPLHQAKKERRREERTVLVLLAEDRLALGRRPDNGLLAGLWELPNVAGRLSAAQAAEQAAAWGAKPLTVERQLTYRHVFTHVEWLLTGYVLCCGAMAPDFTWVTPAMSQSGFPVPAAFRPFLPVQWVE